MDSKTDKKLIAIVGPTASGKTGLAVFLARKFGGEIVSADSRQVYRGLDIGTGKDLSEYTGVKYHLIDICQPGEKFTLFNYLDRARKVVEDIFSRGKLPVVVGGTGLYVQALTQGFELEQNKKLKIKNDKSHPELDSGSPPTGEAVTNSRFRVKPGMTDYQREELEKMSLLKLQVLAKKIDSTGYQKVDQNNPIRLIRLIERAQSGERMSKKKPDFETLQIGINLSREELYQKIDQRVDEWFQDGIIEEIEGLITTGVDPKWLISLGLEYRIITNYILLTKELKDSRAKERKTRCHCEESSTRQSISNGLPRFVKPLLAMTEKDDFDSMKQDLKYKIHQYARKQLTWFRRFPEIKWVKSKEEALEIVKEFVV